jgi:hypothetical protein
LRWTGSLPAAHAASATMLSGVFGSTPARIARLAIPASGGTAIERARPLLHRALHAAVEKPVREREMLRGTLTRIHDAVPLEHMWLDVLKIFPRRQNISAR